MSQPNILLITSDQHRYDCTGYANGYPVRTPSLDALAREGMSFLQAYSPIPTCCPARQAFLSGMRPEALNSYWNYDQGLPQTDTLDPKNAVWTNRLKELGYSSAYIGKWHVNPDKDPLDFGYGSYASEQDYKDFVARKYGPAAVSAKRGMSGKGRGLLGGIDPLPLEDSHTHWLARRAIDRMEAFGREGKPWHIRLDFVEPHLPCEPVQQFYDLFSAADIPPWSSLRDGFENKPYIQRQQPVTWKIDAFGWEDWRDSVRRYYAAVAQMDDAIGRVLAYVREAGLEQNTLILYSTDHGDMGASHGMYDKHYVQYQDVIHVPMIVKWPGVIQPGSRCGEFVYPYLDWAPTVLALWGLPVPGRLHGASLLPLFRGEKVPGWRRQVMTTFNGAQFGLFTQRALTERRYKYIWNATDVDELYDLREDPDEMVNRIADPAFARVLADMRARLHAELAACSDNIARSRWLQGQFLSGEKLQPF